MRPGHLIEDDLPGHSVASVCADLGIAQRPVPPKFLVLYGSLRAASFSRRLAAEAERVLRHFGAEVKIYHPHDLPVYDRTSNDHPEVKRLRNLALWADGHVWISPEQHGTMTGVFKNQVDWIPLSDGAVRPSQGRTVALMQVSGGSQSFNAVNQMRILGRWMRMFVIPNQSSVAKAWKEFDDNGRMKPSDFRDRVVDVCEELFRMTVLLGGRTDALSVRYSEEKQRRDQGKLTPGQGAAK